MKSICPSLLLALSMIAITPPSTSLASGTDDEPEANEALREKARNSPRALELEKKFHECEARVNREPTTSETCQEELSDYLQEVDHQLSKALFK